MSDLPFDLPDDWEVKTVEQLIKEEIIEKPLDGNHGGIHPKAADYVEEGVPFIMASDLESGRVNFDSCKFISAEQASTLRKGFSKAGDVLISHKATIGRTAIVQSNAHDFVVLTPQVTYYRVKNKAKLSNVYLKAYFDSNYFQSLLAQWAGAGSTRAYLGITGQLKLPVIIPPINSQLSIANHVGSINDKIELNRQINQTLEQIAQAIFKSWFVDFEPVKAKIKAKQNGHDPEITAMCTISGKAEEQLKCLDEAALQQLKTTADLFPDALVESELGEIPEGWSVGVIGNIADVIDCLHSKKPSDVEEDTGRIYLQLNNIGDDGLLNLNKKFFIAEEDYTKWTSRIEVKDGDCIITNVGRVGAVSTIPKNVKAAIGRNITAVRLKTEYPYPAFLITLLTSNYMKREIHYHTDVGTILNALNVKSIPNMRFSNGGEDILEVFQMLISPILRQRQEHVAENATLSNIRDVLLPKLLSGELVLIDNSQATEALA